MKSTFKYSEIFHSFQGEGANTGKSTAWIRFFLCNLNCDGFGQKDPTDRSTYILPYKDLDLTGITRVEDLPVFEQGCDSSYTWAKKYRHLAHDDTIEQICDNIQNTLMHESNPNGLFLHPGTHQSHHMAFTGGEPMLNQPAIIGILNEFISRDNLPRQITIETNGTQKITSQLSDLIRSEYTERLPFGHVHPVKSFRHEWFWSVSPKLFSTSGESIKRAIKPESLAEYAKLGGEGQLKYVVNGTQQSWDEVEEHTEAFRLAGIGWDVYIMAVGATKESQEEDTIATIAMEAMKRGYHFSGRLHSHIFGNAIGT